MLLFLSYTPFRVFSPSCSHLVFLPMSLEVTTLKDKLKIFVRQPQQENNICLHPQTCTLVQTVNRFFHPPSCQTVEGCSRTRQLPGIHTIKRGIAINKLFFHKHRLSNTKVKKKKSPGFCVSHVEALSCSATRTVTERSFISFCVGK